MKIELLTQSIESYIGTFFSKEWVQKNVLNFTDNEIEIITKQMNKEMDLIQMKVELISHKILMVLHNYPSMDGEPIPTDDISKYDGVQPPEKDGENK